MSLPQSTRDEWRAAKAASRETQAAEEPKKDSAKSTGRKKQKKDKSNE